ncbi:MULTISPECIES: M14 family metallopeptidase [unclassified Streptomyces]|uniref:M14 family metallopeptidase n=1 Tax=unclassified Streptomyces TaxID=2593676 RepID=UPI000749B934|nr:MULTISPECIES: M14 family metallopeptidase [unclassified Streptomyces]KUL53624.1 peptidase M14 [Streptomyces sp. NRRL S-1521]THC48935.1 zinc carboxypeptidase [Streptomyces sp. A1499]
MRRRASARSILAASALLLGGLAAAPHARASGPAATADAGDQAAVKVYRADVTKQQIPILIEAGQDAHELAGQAPDKGTGRVELYLTEGQAKAVERQGVELSEHKVPAAAEKRIEAAGDGVYRPYSGKGGLKEEIVRTGQANPGITKVVSIGKTVRGKDILALKLTKNARKSKDGSKPSTLYMSNQHAREWITPEMTRRLMHHYLDNYGKDKRVTKLVDSTELWFVLSANPDGYDFTHAAEGNRQWRKNLRDIDGDGRIAPGDGVDLNRNFAYKWGYDNEGSSPEPSSETYRGTGPMSEPETKAIDRFQKRIGFTYGINYHSAAQLLLYGVGWQVATPTPDDVLYRALNGTPEKPAVPGYHPQVSSELYTTNGEADGHAGNINGTAMFTPEMSTCQTASNVDPGDAWKPEDCASIFTFPDDERLIQQEFAKNVPFALAVAETALHPDQPVSVTDIEAPDFTPDSFTTSYARGGDQEVAVTARKSVRHKELNYRINGGRTRDEDLRAWKGGETYGGEDNLYFDEYRAEIEDARVGDEVEVWFTGRTKKGRTQSERFTYTVAERPKANTLVVAEEGASATQTRKYVDAVRDSGRSAAVWDVAKQGVPHPLGVLSHFSAVVHYTGDPVPGAPTQLALRSYLNEGGKLIESGERTGGNVDLGEALTDDFAQYYLGAYERLSAPGVSGFDGAGALARAKTPLTAAEGNPLDKAGRFTVTSDNLPAKEFPRFRSAAAGSYPGLTNPYAPFEGQGMASAAHADQDYKRLTRTLDLTGVTAADAPELRFALNWNLENGYDHGVLEARTAGGEDWTTLPDKNGNSSAAVPAECGAGFLLNLHPFLRHYLTQGADACTASGTSGQWHSFTGSSSGFKPVAFDLSAYAGKKVEVSLSAVTDPSTGGRGLFADNARLVVGGTATETEGFESSLGSWTVAPAPAGSPNITGDWTRSGELYRPHAAVTARDSVLLGFGFEHVPGKAERAALMGAALAHLRG